MEDKRALLPINGSLPEPAKQWLDAFRAAAISNAECDTQLRAIYQHLEEMASHLQLPEYSVKAFRDLHFLQYPDTSVAGLDICDELFLNIIWAGAYTIEELEQKLDSGEIGAATFRPAAESRNGQALKELEQALREWRLSHQNRPGRAKEI